MLVGFFSSPQTQVQSLPKQLHHHHSRPSEETEAAPWSPLDHAKNLWDSFTSSSNSENQEADDDEFDSSILEIFDVLDRLSGREILYCSLCIPAVCPAGQQLLCPRTSRRCFSSAGSSGEQTGQANLHSIWSRRQCCCLHQLGCQNAVAVLDCIPGPTPQIASTRWYSTT